MFEVILVAVVSAALVPPLLLLCRVSALRNRIEQALAGSRQADEQMQSLVAAQRDLLVSFDVFDKLLVSLQHSYDGLSVTARAFVCAFRERAVSYMERGCEGSLREFLEQMADRLRIHESGCRIQRTLPEVPQAIAELAYWQGQWILGMGPAQICGNTVAIARACRAFLFAGKLCKQALSPHAVRVFEELLDFTHLVETTLLTDVPVGIKSVRLESLADSAHRSCERLPIPAVL